MKGWGGYQNSPAKQKKNDKGDEDDTYMRKEIPGEPIRKKSNNKERNQAIERINDVEDELEWLKEDLFNEKISKSQYDAKAKILNMKIDARRKAVGFDK